MCCAARWLSAKPPCGVMARGAVSKLCVYKCTNDTVLVDHPDLLGRTRRRHAHHPPGGCHPYLLQDGDSDDALRGAGHGEAVALQLRLPVLPEPVELGRVALAVADALDACACTLDMTFPHCTALFCGTRICEQLMPLRVQNLGCTGYDAAS